MADIPEHSLHCACVGSEVHNDGQAEVDAVAEVASADVAVAQIEAERDVTLARIAAKVEESHDETEVEALQAELRAMRETLALLSPAPEVAPEPAPVIVNDVTPVDEPPSLPEPEHQAAGSEPKPKKSSSSGLGFW
jgi:hypothetical protein